MKILVMITCVVISCGVSSCAKAQNNSNLKGTLLGYSAEGIVALDISSGNYNVVLRNDSVHRWVSPVYDKKTGQLFVLDGVDNNCVYRWNGFGVPQILYTVPVGHKIGEQISLSPTGKSLVFTESWEGSSGIIKVISINNEVVAEINIKGTVRDLRWISEDVIIGLLYQRINGEVHKTVVEWTVSNGQSRSLKDVTGLGLGDGIWFDVTDSGKNISIADVQEKLVLHVVLYDLATMKPLYEYTDNELHGHSSGWPCSTGGTKIAVYRQYDPMIPIGTYIIDIKNKEATKITDKRISDMIYFADWNGEFAIPVPEKKSETGSKPSE